MNLHRIFITAPLYPILCFTVALMAGIWWQSTEHTYFFYIFIAAFIGIGVYLNKRLYACSPIFMALYGIAFILGSSTYSHVITSQAEFCNVTHNKKFDIIVKINSITPSLKTYMGNSCICTLESMQSHEDQSVKYYRRIHLLIYIPLIENIHIGDTILIKGVHFKTPKNSHYLLYLAKEHITTSASALKSHIEIIHHPKYSIARIIAEYTKRLDVSFRSTLTQETYYAFSSIFLGNPLAKKKESALQKKLNQWGIVHYIARSGLHLLIFVSIWMLILSYIPLPWIIRQLSMMLLVLLYSLLSWPSIPFNRALYTFLLVKTSYIIQIKTYFISTLACVTCITLLSSPLSLFSLNFQLSFGITYALAWLNEIRAQRDL